MQPSVSRLGESMLTPDMFRRLNVGLYPTMPQNAAGRITEPPVCVPNASGTIPSATAAALIDALNKHNEREPSRRAIFLNYSAIDPALTNERCSFWHFRFDAHADMRLAALTDVLREDQKVKKLYLIGQDYSFGQHVLRKGREMIVAKRQQCPGVTLVDGACAQRGLHRLRQFQQPQQVRHGRAVERQA